LWRDGPTRRGLLLLPLALAACGFAPAYAPGGAGNRLRGRVAVAPPDTPDGYRLGARLEDRLGLAAAPAATLEVEVAVEEAVAAEGLDGDPVRRHLRGRAPWRLVAPSGAVLAQGEEAGFTASADSGEVVAARAAEADARERLMVLLADRIVTQLLLLEDLP
jgi:LPS-assembly lipoprotein